MNLLRLRWIVLGMMWLVLFGCSVDKEDHPNWLSEAACKKRGRAWKFDRGFCYRIAVDKDAEVPDEDGGVEDAAVSDGAIDGAASDGGDGAIEDAGPMEPCEPGQTEACYDGDDEATALQPPCRAGTRTCVDGRWGDCEGDRLPALSDSCNGKDDDCDGLIDEHSSLRSCEVEDASVLGACKEGLAVCDRGQDKCVRYVFPTRETCDGVDEDCDGIVDEDTDVECYEDVVGCALSPSGVWECVPGSTCATGRHQCDGGELGNTCVGMVGPSAEVQAMSGEPVDEDCDGAIDEGFNCTSGTMFQCYTGPADTRYTAPCQGGTRTCTGGVLESACVGEVTPGVETCANPGVDDDCNGVIDDVPRLGSSCAELSDAVGACQANAQYTCEGNVEQCTNGTPGDEVCDGQGGDEDCDTRSDEGFAFATDEDNCGSCGVRCGANQQCCGGVCVDVESSNSHCGMCGNTCPSGRTCCAGGCVDTRTDRSHCGTCDTPCLLGGLLTSCANSMCKLL